MKKIILLIVLFIGSISVGQDMNAGFKLLENGEYLKAKTYFGDVLTQYPDNKTARLCYGRALGLSGSTEMAQSLFIDLKADYPQDFEVALNYAESLLWAHNFIQAKKVYKNLIAQDSTSFSAVLGYANTLSNLMEYDTALAQVNRALILQPKNANALISRKYMRLGKAAQLNSDTSYDAALALLIQNLEDFPKDADTQNSLANVYIAQKNYTQADKTYQQLTDTVSVLIGRSLVAHLMKKDKKALDYAEKATIYAKKHPKKILTAKERYLQALIWNGQYKKARTLLATVNDHYKNNKRVGALAATLGMYTGKFSQSIKAYKAILAQDSTSFDGNLGIANAYRAQGNLDKAYAFAKRTLTFHPGQKDAKTLIKTIEATLAPVVETQGAYTRDNGNNKAYAAGIYATIPFSERLRTSFNYTYRTTENKTTKTMAYNTEVSLGAQYRVLNNTWVEGALGFVKAHADVNDYTDVNGSVFVKSRPLPLQYLEVGYSRALQNFNAALIDEKIFMNNYSLNYNMGTNINLGWYTGLMHTQQTDGNSRNLLFTSLYYTFTKSPALKGGLNYQYLSFKNQVPTLYFSPARYQAAELFLDLTGTAGQWSYAANAAAGYQFVEQDDATTLFRLEAKLKYALTNRFEMGAYAKYSNIASATAAGFEFTEVGLRLRWQVLNRPMFKL